MDLDSPYLWVKTNSLISYTVPITSIDSSLLINNEQNKNLYGGSPSSQLIITLPSPRDIPINTLMVTLSVPHEDLMDIMPHSNNALNASNSPIASTLHLSHENSNLNPLSSAMQTIACHNELPFSSKDFTVHQTTPTNSHLRIMVGSMPLKSISLPSSPLVWALVHSLHSGPELPSSISNDIPKRESPKFQYKCVASNPIPDFQPLIARGPQSNTHLRDDDSNQHNVALLLATESIPLSSGTPFCQSLWGQPTTPVSVPPLTPYTSHPTLGNSIKGKESRIYKGEQLGDGKVIGSIENTQDRCAHAGKSCKFRIYRASI